MCKVKAAAEPNTDHHINAHFLMQVKYCVLTFQSTQPCDATCTMNTCPHQKKEKKKGLMHTDSVIRRYNICPESKENKKSPVN